MGPSGRIVPTVATLLVDDRGNGLFVESRNPAWAYPLAIPSGECEPGESLQSAASRHLESQVGIQIAPKELLSLGAHKFLGDSSTSRWEGEMFWMQTHGIAISLARAGGRARRVEVVPLESVTAQMMGFDFYSVVRVVRRLLAGPQP